MNWSSCWPAFSVHVLGVEPKLVGFMLDLEGGGITCTSVGRANIKLLQSSGQGETFQKLIVANLKIRPDLAPG